MTDVEAASPTGPSDDEAVTRLAIIRDAGLFVDDPETIPDRHHPIPAGMEPVRLLKDYDTSRTTGRKVRCSACVHHQHHHRGFVAEMPDGRPALIGINCGEKHFGDGAWERMNADLRREQDDVYYAARVHPALEQITATHARAVGLKAAVRSYEDEMRRTKVCLPDLFKLLGTACSDHEGYMDQHVRRRFEVVGPDGRHTTKDQTETKRFGRVPAPAALITRSAMHDLDAAIGTLREAKLRFEQGADTHTRRAAFAELGRGRRLAEDFATTVRGYARNSEMGWWQQAINFCLAERRPGSLSIRGRTIHHSSDGFHHVEASIPQWTAADVARADELVRAWPTGA